MERSTDASRSRGVGRVELVCRFQQQTAKLTGRCDRDVDSGATVSGDVQGQNAVWQFEIALQPDSPKQVVTFKATLDDAGAAMQGTFVIAGFEGRFSAKKQLP